MLIIGCIFLLAAIICMAFGPTFWLYMAYDRFGRFTVCNPKWWQNAIYWTWLWFAIAGLILVTAGASV